MENMYSDIAARIIPLPKRLSEGGNRQVLKGNIRILSEWAEKPALSALHLLEETFGRPDGAEFTIRLVRAAGEAAAELQTLKNSGQAYSITPDYSADGTFNGFRLAALQPAGIYYAALTLLQAADVNGCVVIMPELTVTDWPDMPLRGQWGGDVAYDLENTALMKLNAIDYTLEMDRDTSGAYLPYFKRDDIVEECARRAVELTPYIPHIEQITMNYPQCFDDELLKKIKNTPSKEMESVCDYKPSMCMSSEDTFSFLHEWLNVTANTTGVGNIQVWLSESPSPCHCEKCKGKGQFELETALLCRAFASVRETHPDMTFEILLTQGSYSENGRIAGMVPDYVRLTYYDGGRTYSSDKNPMIYDVLEAYAARGGRLGVYPQITHAWRLVFPWTGPDFIRFRCREFVEKGLDKVIGYAVPANSYHRANVAALAEWLWNSGGRDEDAFAHAWALKKGYDPDVYVKWNRLNMGPAWDLAASRFLLAMVFCYPVVQKNDMSFWDHRAEFTDFEPVKNVEDAIARSAEAAKLAGAAGLREEALESFAITNALKCSRAFFSIFQDQHADDHTLRQAYAELYGAAQGVYRAVLDWDNVIKQNSPALPSFPDRVVDTAVVLLRVLDAAYDRLKKDCLESGLQTERLYHHLGEWDESLFTGETGVLRYDVTDIVTRPGTYHACFDFIQSEASTLLDRLRIYEEDGGKETLISDTASSRRLNHFEPWCELLFEVEKVGDGRKILEITLKGPEIGESVKTRRGIAGIRAM